HRLLPGQPEDRISDASPRCVRCVVRDRRLHCDVLVCVADGVPDVSTPTGERPARDCHSYFVDRLAVRIDRGPLLSTSTATVMKDPFDFTGKVALVTGSSRGIGAEMIQAFGTRGAQCVVNYVFDEQGRNKADALSVAKELNDPLVIECDVTQPQ